MLTAARAVKSVSLVLRYYRKRIRTSSCGPGLRTERCSAPDPPGPTTDNPLTNAPVKSSCEGDPDPRPQRAFTAAQRAGYDLLTRRPRTRDNCGVRLVYLGSADLIVHSRRTPLAAGG